MAIEGNGFFVLQSLETGSTDYLYTRDGSFTLNSQNNLVDAFAHKVMGYGVTPDPVTGELVIDTTRLVPLNIPIGVDSFAGPTRNILYNGNLDGNSAVATTYNTTSQIYDSLGNPHTMTMTFTKTAMGPPSTWDYAAQIDGNAATGTGTLAYDVNGQFDAANSTMNPITYTIAPPNGADTLNITPTFADTTQLRGENTLAASDQDGYSLGTVNGFTIGNDGVIIASATNGQFREIGQVALATFSNPEGLLRTGSNLFIQTPNSGLNQIDVPLSGQRGSITAEYLEDSNVELSDEFTKMIVTQRAFQANSKVITTASDMLAEVNNLIR
jgi:flagellar hook protein FlgE